MSDSIYRLIIDNTFDWEYWVDPKGSVRYSSPSCETLSGYNPSEFLNNPNLLYEIIHPDDQAGFLAHIDQYENKRIPSKYEFRIICRNGVERWIGHMCQPIFDQDGKYLGRRASNRDITEIKVTEAKIHDLNSELELRVLERTAQLNTVVRRLENEVAERRQTEEALFQSNRELLALNAVSASLNQPFDMVHLLEAALSRLLDVLKLKGGWVHLLEEEITPVLHLTAQSCLPESLYQAMQEIPIPNYFTTQPDHTAHLLVNTVTGILNGIEAPTNPETYPYRVFSIRARDKVVGVLGVINDGEVSERELNVLQTLANEIGIAVENSRLANLYAAVDLFREIDHMRTELIANVSHELRTPLGLILIMVTTLLREDMTLEKNVQLELLHDIEEETRHLQGVVENLLDVTRLQTGKLQLVRKPFDFRCLALHTLDAMKYLIGQRRANTVLPILPLLVNADEKRVEIVLRNLISNAIKYSPDGTEISVIANHDERMAIIQVIDQGSGIPEDKLDKIFEPFYRVSSNDDRLPTGVGLGLYITRGIVEAHAGQIWAESEIDKGSTFFFTLPLASGLL